MKNMKKLVFLLIALLAVLALVGCGGDDNGDNGDGNGTTDADDVDVDNGDGDTDGDGTETAQWAGYNFGTTVKPSSGGSGKVKTFTYEFAYNDDDGLRKMNVEGTYLGTVNEPILTQKMTYSTATYDFTYENITTMMNCYKVKHRVTVIANETDETYPAWAETTLWIPVDVPETSAQSYWLYPKAEYVDSDGDEGSWSYYLTDAMENESQNPPAGTSVTYVHAWEGEVYHQGFFDWTYLGLYGWGWSWFKDFAEGGAQELHEGTWGGSAYGYSYDCDKVEKTVGGYKFDAWSLDFTVNLGDGESGGYQGIFSEDLAMPLYWRFGSSSGGDGTYWEYTMTDLELD